jgi:dipeptidyl aminopeptidase/acylaminoacyl peptidase
VLVVHGADDARVPIAHTRDYVATARAAGAAIELHEHAELSHLVLIDPAAPHWAGVHDWLDQRG